VIGAPIEIRPYDPESAADRFRFVDALVRLHLAHLTKTAPFRPEWVDGAWWLAMQLEAAARMTKGS
jgi:hypothetical protein